MIKKVIHIVLMLILLAGTLVLLGFAGDHNRRLPCREFMVSVDKDCGNSFIDAEDVRQALVKQLEWSDGQPVEHGMLKKIKQRVETNPYVDRAAIYRSVEGNLFVDISQRTPVLRVINTQNQGYYIDRTGKLLPLSTEYTARVMVAAGHVRAGYNPATTLADADTQEAPVPGEKTLRELYHLATFIDNDPFWKAFIDQIYVTPSGQFELMPVNGAHTIELGMANDLERKFGKLKIFYQTGLSRVGWNYYKRINLKFENQIVCSK